jgi:putative nucleotidyltransferase with HDIG domain
LRNLQTITDSESSYRSVHPSARAGRGVGGFIRRASGRNAPPRLVVRATVANLMMAGFLLSAVFIVVALDVRERVRGAVTERLDASQRMLTALERRRAKELQDQVATLAENPTLRAALYTYELDLLTDQKMNRRALVATVARELEKLAGRVRADVLALADASGATIAAAGRRRDDWPVQAHVPAGAQSAASFISGPSGVFRTASVDVVFQDHRLGSLQLATALDNQYTRELSVLSGADALIVSQGEAIASTIAKNRLRMLTGKLLAILPARGTIRLDNAEYAVRLLFSEGPASVYVLDSIDESAAEPMQHAARAIEIIALGAFVVAGIASIWLARTIARPIDTLSRSLSEMTRARDFENPLPATGSSLEVDTLTDAFNTMMHSVSVAEAETRSAYVGAIRALALALDARDPYTAGHSERVSALSVAIGRQMALTEEELEILRLGALLHDIGKIGISDNVLRKPGPLTAEEFEMIRQHPGVGARILRSIQFLAPHIPIVELHHERPDGKGYPYGLRDNEIPVAARIVHVADAFDAMTSARAYRPIRRGAQEALRELWRNADSQFDAEVVQALVDALPAHDLARAAETPLLVAASQPPRLSIVSARS